VCGKEWNSRHFVERSYRKTSTVSNKTETELSIERWSSKEDLQWERHSMIFKRQEEFSNTIIPDDGLRCQEKVKNQIEENK